MTKGLNISSELVHALSTGVYDFHVNFDIGHEELLTASIEVFQNSSVLLANLDGEEVARLMHELSKPAGIGLWETIGNANIDAKLRLLTLDAMKEAFRVFDDRCTGILVSDKKARVNSPLDIACYMWWECAPSFNHLEPVERNLFQEHLVCLLDEIIRQYSNPSCQESVVHGLLDLRGELHLAEEFLKQLPRCESLSNEVREYLVNALGGGT